MGPQSKDRAKTTPAVMCIKILLHVFNFIYLILGACVLAIGIWLQVQLKQYMEITEMYYDKSPWIMVGVGVLILIVAIGGFCCTAKDKVALLYMYGIFITVLAVLQIAAGIAGGVFSSKIDQNFKSGLTDTIGKQKFMKAWDDVQRNLHCCGVESPDDWLTIGKQSTIPKSCDSSVVKTTANPVPSNATTTPVQTATTQAPSTNGSTTNSSSEASSTTPMTNPTTTVPKTITTGNGTNADNNTPNPQSGRRKRQAANDDREPFQDGCHKLIKDKVQNYLSIIVGVCVGFVLLQIIGAILACCLARKTSKNNYEQIY